MPGPVIPKPTSLFPDWVKPENASVFDPGWRGPLRTLINLLGLDDPQQVMSVGAAMEAGSAGGGMLDALAAKFPRVAKAIKAYHGSPHEFAPEPGAPLGRFNMEKIGTGEGNQSFGHGLYFSETPAVAKLYRERLAPSITAIPEYQTHLAAKQAWTDATLAHLQQPSAATAQRVKETATVAQGAEQRLIAARRGAMYEVNIHADPEHFLDWDKPLNEQPHVQAVLDAAPVRKPMDRIPFQRPNVPASEAYRAMVERYGSSEAAAKALRDAGIPGIKYFDASSRTAGEGTRNYVVFDDKTIEILRKYGLLLPMAGAASQALPLQPQQEQ